MKTESSRDDDARDYWLSDRSGERVMQRARAIAKECGESFVMFIGALAVPRTAVRVYRDKNEAVEDARAEANMHRGFRSAPKIHLKRIKV